MNAGARGIAPPEAATTVGEPATTTTPVTAATRVAPVDPPTADHAGAVAARQPRAPRPGHAPPPAPVTRDLQRAERVERPARRRKGRIRRAFAMLVVAILVGGGIAVAYVATDESGSAVQLRDVVYNEVDRAIDELRKLVQDNTR